MTTLSAERITAVIFDPQTPPAGLGASLARLFGRKATSAPRHLSLAEARNRLVAEGLARDKAHIITSGVESMMQDELRSFISMQAFKNQGDVFIVNDIDWSDRHYLGVTIKDKGLDFTQDAQFLADIRNHFLHELSEWLLSPASSSAPAPVTPHA